MSGKHKHLYKIFLAGLLAIFLLVGYHDTKAWADEDDGYYIRVNVGMNCITIYGKDNLNQYTILVKAMVCSANVSSVDGSVVYVIKGKEEWKQTTDGTFVHWASNLDGVTALCSTPYSAQDSGTLLTDKFNGLGTEYSPENIWMNSSDAKWIYDNCKEGTIVEIYSDTSAAGALGKPNTIKIPAASTMASWDPTDEAEENPWKTTGARIEGAKNIDVYEGSEVDLLKGIKVYDTCGNDMTDKLLIMGEYDLSREGTYTITYYYMDAIGSQASESVNLTVKPKPQTVVSQTSSETNTSEKSNGQKIKIIILLGVLSLAGAIGLIRKSKQD